MRFRLLDKDGKQQVHEGVMPKNRAPVVITWGNRAFKHEDGEGDVAVYREVDTYRIGGFS